MHDGASETSAARWRRLRQALAGLPPFRDSGGRYYLTRWVFLRLLGLIYLVAFVSYWVQVEGLVGSGGILPAEGLAQALREHLGLKAYRVAPSLFWLYPHDAMLHILCGGGVALSVVLAAGLLPTLCLTLLWAFYLSLVTFSQDFLAFQWDSLLLEVGFLAVFFAPFQAVSRLERQAAPSLVMLWLLRLLTFRLMFGSGFVKLYDETWRTFTALLYHFETQPLPTPVAWYANQLPARFLEAATFLTLFAELTVPFFVFGTRRWRLVGFVILAGFQALIMLTGNFAFFNWLSLVLCVLLLDDDHFRRIIPAWLSRRARCPEAPPLQWVYARAAAYALAGIVVLLSLVQFARLVDRSLQPPRPVAPVVQALEPFRLVNPYGLFAAMTTIRPEIVVEGSHDGTEWRAYEFKWKPGNPDRAPGFVAPHQPRLDWQMWFAALGPPGQSPWFGSFMVRLLQGSPEVLALLEENPFPEAPPRYVRATLYQYAFTRRGDGAAGKDWWVREELGPYFPRMALR